MESVFPKLWETFPKALGMPEPCYNLANTKQCLLNNDTMFKRDRCKSLEREKNAYPQSSDSIF